MGEEIAFENSQISDFQGLATLTVILDRVILHTVMHHTSTATYIPNFIEIEETFCGRTDGHLRPTLLGRLLKMEACVLPCNFICDTDLLVSFQVKLGLSVGLDFPSPHVL